MPGPPPKRSAERRRKNPPAAGVPTILEIDSLPADDPNSLPFLIRQPIVIPEPVTGHEVYDDDRHEKAGWHPIAREFWDSFLRSGQALYWEPSDWMMAKLLCESLSRDLKPQFVGVTQGNDMGPSEAIYEKIPLKGASLSAYLKLASQLMLTEGERRRLALELEREREPKKASATGKVLPFKDRRAAMLRGTSSG
jgi:hypothetical protein